MTIPSPSLPDASPLPITLVTPSYQQAEFLPRCLDSVLSQEYPRLEYYVLDGGSSDGSRDIIEARSSQLAGWRSEPDEGQYAAIAEGLNRGQGEILGWINADDLHFPWTLRLVASLFTQFPDIEWITTLRPVIWNQHGIPINVGQQQGFSASLFRKGVYLTRHGSTRTHCIQQESTFWRRSLWEKVGGGFSPETPLAGDFDLWARMFDHADLVGVGAPLAGFRKHGNQRSVREHDQYVSEARRTLVRHGYRMEQTFSAWARAKGWGKRWPFRHLPSLGLIQPVDNVWWSGTSSRWERVTQWVDG